MSGSTNSAVEIQVERLADAPEALRVAESTFHSDPAKYLEIVRRGQQVLVVDDEDSERVVLAIGTNGVHVAVMDQDAVGLAQSVEGDVDSVDYEAWLR